MSNRKFTLADLPIGTKVRLKAFSTIKRNHTHRRNQDCDLYFNTNTNSFVSLMYKYCGKTGIINRHTSTGDLIITIEDDSWCWSISCIKEIIK